MGQFWSNAVRSCNEREEERRRQSEKQKIERFSPDNWDIYRSTSVESNSHESVEEKKSSSPAKSDICRSSSVESNCHESVVEEKKQVPSILTDSNARRVVPREDVKRSTPTTTVRSVKQERWIKHYSSSHKILLVGEGDFSFSACLARSFGSADKMVATSLDSIGFLQIHYKSAMSNIIELESLGCTVMHEVDATQMADHCSLKELLFDRIVYNFPLAGFFWDESRESQIRRNQHLVRLFFKNAKKMITKNGEIHVTHKSAGFFLEWDLVKLAYGLRLKEEVYFDLDDYPGYNNKYGYGGDKNFDCKSSKTYKFELKT